MADATLRQVSDTVPFGVAATRSLAPAAAQIKEVKVAAEAGRLRLDFDLADALLRDIAGLRLRVAELVQRYPELDVPLEFGDNWVGRIMSDRLRAAAADDNCGVITVLRDFELVLTDLEGTVKVAVESSRAADEAGAATMAATMATAGGQAGAQVKG